MLPRAFVVHPSLHHWSAGPQYSDGFTPMVREFCRVVNTTIKKGVDFWCELGYRCLVLTPARVGIR